MKKISMLALLLVFFVTNLNNVNAADLKYIPTAEFFVNDFANVLSSQTEEEIFNISRTTQEKTTAQLVVVTVPNMDGGYIESYANTLFNKWGIGTKEKNNGVLLILSVEERKIRIEVGYGLEGAINDAKAGRILDTYAVAPLEGNNYDNAILDTVKQLQYEVYKEYKIDYSSADPNFVPMNESSNIDSKQVFIFLAIFIFLVIVTKGKIIEWIFWAMMFSNGRSGGGGGRFGGGGGSSGGGGASRGF